MLPPWRGSCSPGRNARRIEELESALLPTEERFFCGAGNELSVQQWHLLLEYATATLPSRTTLVDDSPRVGLNQKQASAIPDTSL